MGMDTGCTDMSDASQAAAMDGDRQGSGGRRCSTVPWGRATAFAAVGLGLMAVSLGALADSPEGAGYGHHGMWGGGGWGGMFFGFFMMLLVIAAIAAAVILVARVGGGAGFGSAEPSGKTPQNV